MAYVPVFERCTVCYLIDPDRTNEVTRYTGLCGRCMQYFEPCKKTHGGEFIDALSYWAMISDYDETCVICDIDYPMYHIPYCDQHELADITSEQVKNAPLFPEITD